MGRKCEQNIMRLKSCGSNNQHDLLVYFSPLLFLPALPFAFALIIYDELRRLAIRTWPHGWVGKEFYTWQRSSYFPHSLACIDNIPVLEVNNLCDSLLSVKLVIAVVCKSIAITQYLALYQIMTKKSMADVASVTKKRGFNLCQDFGASCGFLTIRKLILSTRVEVHMPKTCSLEENSVNHFL